MSMNVLCLKFVQSDRCFHDHRRNFIEFCNDRIFSRDDPTFASLQQKFSFERHLLYRFSVTVMPLPELLGMFKPMTPYNQQLLCTNILSERFFKPALGQ